MHKHLSVRALGRITITISDEIEDRFRKGVAAKYGWKKGAMSEAIEEALRDWLRKQQNTSK
jgi:hypothetical protein